MKNYLLLITVLVSLIFLTVIFFTPPVHSDRNYQIVIEKYSYVPSTYTITSYRKIQGSMIKINQIHATDAELDCLIMVSKRMLINSMSAEQLKKEQEKLDSIIKFYRNEKNVKILK